MSLVKKKVYVVKKKKCVRPFLLFISPPVVKKKVSTNIFTFFLTSGGETKGASEKKSPCGEKKSVRCLRELFFSPAVVKKKSGIRYGEKKSVCGEKKSQPLPLNPPAVAQLHTQLSMLPWRTTSQ